MIRNNERDPNAQSVWLNKKQDYDVGVPMSNCYSNLSIYGTNYGTNNTHPYVGQNSMEHLDGGIIKKIEVPYPVEPVPEIILKMGNPHRYDSGFNSKYNILNYGLGYDHSDCKRKHPKKKRTAFIAIRWQRDD
jgi:hypothetical protein